MPASITIEIEGEALALLDELSANLGRTRASLVQEAVEEWLAWQAEEIAAIKAGSDEADRGIFATDEEVERIFRKYDQRP